MRSSTRTAAAVLTAAVLAVAASACSEPGDKSEGGGGAPKGKKVSARSGDLGKMLAGGEDRTLYLFEKDKSTKSTCSGACAEAWPPMTVKDSPEAGNDVQKGLLGTTKRSGGDRQVTYDGHPLYYFKEDGSSGETKGQDLDQFGAKWFVLDTDGRAIKKKPKDGGGGGGY